MDDILTDEELATLQKRVWDKCKEDISKAVEQAITSSLSSHFYRIGLRTMAESEIRKLLKPKIEARKAEIEVRLDKLVDRIGNVAVDVVEREIRDMVTSSSRALLDRLSDVKRDWDYRLTETLRKKLEGITKEEKAS